MIPVNRGANPGYFPDPGQIGIPRFPGIPAKSGLGQDPEYFPDPGPIGIGKIPAIFPAKSESGRGGAGFGDFGVWPFLEATSTCGRLGDLARQSGQVRSGQVRSGQVYYSAEV